MDHRFEDASIFEVRRLEWNKDIIKSHIDEIFKTLENMENWTYHGSQWTHPVLTKNTKEELKQSVFSILKVDASRPDGKHQEYKFQVPDLIKDQFFYIGGYYKVPIFQLYDMPIICRFTNTETLSFNSLRFRNNAITITLNIKNNTYEEEKKAPYPVKIFNKNIPFEILLGLIHTEDEVLDALNSVFGISSYQTSNINGRIIEIVDKARESVWSLDLSEEERDDMLGRYFAAKSSDSVTKGKDVRFSLKTAYDIDHFSRRFYYTNSILTELLVNLDPNILFKRGKGDTDIRNKRLRLGEYILAPLIKKVYDFMLTVHRNHRDKFQIPQNIILESCNASVGEHKNSVAHIIHYNFPINPVGEIASLMQSTLVGPGGFKKDNVPPHLRNINDSQFGILCPSDTPDRDGCGVVNNLVPTVELNRDLTFNFDKIKQDMVTSLPISMVPFMENDDATRLQMASSQIKQSVYIKGAEKALVRSGLEDAYLGKSTFCHTAKKDGLVLYVDDEYMIIVYDDADPYEIEMFEINYRTMYLNTVDVIDTKYRAGDRFETGDVLCQSKFIQDGEMALGKNLLTAVMVWKGYNYEDGIVISDSIVKDMQSMHSVDLSYNIECGQILLSLESDTYKPFPKVGDEIKCGEVYAKIKNIDWEAGIENINEEAIEQTSPEDCTISSIALYPNSWNKEIPEFTNEIRKKMDTQLDRYNRIVNSLTPYMDEDEIIKFTKRNGISNLNCDKHNIGKYVTKGQKVGGVYVELKGVYKQNICVGDKIANRHGNKGVIARIIPEREMPIFEDGRRPDIIINPLGIISRMNVGQLFEMHMGEAIHQLKCKIMSECDDSKSGYKKAELITKQFMNIVDHTDGKWASKKILKEFKKNYQKSGSISNACEHLYTIQPPFKSTPPDKLFEAMDFVGAKVSMKLKDPSTGLDIENPIALGYMYFDKLVHRATEKLSARSIGPYNKKTSQPISGKSNRGGHRLGEMEVWALLAHDAKLFLNDLLTTHSDSIGKKNRVLAEILQNPSLVDSEEELDDKPQSLRVMEAYLNTIGLTMDYMDNSEDNISYLFNENYNRSSDK